MIQEKEKQSQAETQEQGENWMQIAFAAQSENEGFARVCVAAFVTRLDPTLEEINDVKTAVSEAVTNSVIHGYGGNGGKIIIECSVENNTMEVMIKDFGKGIADVEKAMEPMYTTDALHERSGMGFTFMEVFMDELKVVSEKGGGTTVIMKKTFGRITE